MKIIYKQGDLLKCDENIILHGCNAQGVMGSGVAKAIRAKWPAAYSTYKRSGHTLGSVTLYVHKPTNKSIFNVVTQEFYGRDSGNVYVDYGAITFVIRKVDEWCSFKEGVVRIAMPKIVAGLGRGDWEVVAKIIEEESTHFQPVVYQL